MIGLEKGLLSGMRYFFSLAMFALSMSLSAGNVINVTQDEGSAAKCIMAAIRKAASFGGDPVTIKLATGVWRMSRDEAEVRPYYVSNTCSEEENPDVSKHIAVLLRGLRNVTIDGCGSTILLDGLMTAFVIDSCENVTLRNIAIDNAHPTQVEMTVEEDAPDHLVCRVHPTSQYRIADGKVEWYGRGWSFRDCIAQMYDRRRDVTWRSWSPTEVLDTAYEVTSGRLFFKYRAKPKVPVGTVFQLRDSFRREVCGLVWQSRKVNIEDVQFYFLGNFGVVGQVSEDIRINHCWFAPREGSGRTNAGYADFIQMSGCRGYIDISDCKFAGAHDDAINVHGTHLRVLRSVAPDRLLLRYMHPQTYGFQSFHTGDSIEIVNPMTLLPVGAYKVKDARMLTPRELEITLTGPVHAEHLQGERVVENITWTPSVHISHCHFSRIPTRGILITTRRPSVVEHCTFYGMPMSAVLIADDARNWFESGPVHSLNIRYNIFDSCAGPVIQVSPENAEQSGAVHRNIYIVNNVFHMCSRADKTVVAHSVDGLHVSDNIVTYNDETPIRP